MYNYPYFIVSDPPVLAKPNEHDESERNVSDINCEEKHIAVDIDRCKVS